jgi:CHASE2 domain-containing sensor protein
MSLVRNLVGAVAVTCLVVWLFNGFATVRRVDELIYAFRFPTGDSVSPDILLVEITQATLKRLGDWPIDREFHATLLEKVARNSGNIIGVTFWFSRPLSEPGDSQLARVARLNKNIVFSRPTWTTDSSGRVLYRELEDAKPTTAVELYIDDLSGSLVGLTAIYTHLSSPVSRWLEVLPVKLFRIFREPKTISSDPRSFETNAFDFIRKYKLQFASADPISLEPFVVKMPINYVGDAQVFQRVAYERLLENEDFSWIRNKIIIIGLALPGRGIFTPLSFSTGIETSQPVVIANAINTLLTGHHVRTLHPIITSGLVGLYCIILLFLFRRLKSVKKRVGIGIGVFLGLLVLSHLLFAAFRFQMVIFPYFLVWIFVQSYFVFKDLLPSQTQLRSEQ